MCSSDLCHYEATMQKTQKEILEDFARGRECAEQVCMMLAGRLGDDADTLQRSVMISFLKS